MWTIPGGLVDAHAHLSFEPHDVFMGDRVDLALEAGAPAAIAAASSAAHAFFGTGSKGAVGFDADPHEDPSILAHPRALP